MDKQKIIAVKGSKQEINDLLALFEDGQIGEFDKFSILDIVKIRESCIAEERSQPLANIKNWLQGVFEAGWQDLDDLFFEQQTQVAWRSPELRQTIEDGLRQTLAQLANSSEVLRAKILNLEIQLGVQSIALVVAISENEPKTTVRLMIYSMTDLFLPLYLNLKVIDESDNIFLEVQARISDNYLQLQFSGDRGEHFSIQLSLGEIMLTEEFII